MKQVGHRVARNAATGFISDSHHQLNVTEVQDYNPHAAVAYNLMSPPRSAVPGYPSPLQEGAPNPLWVGQYAQPYLTLVMAWVPLGYSRIGAPMVASPPPRSGDLRQVPVRLRLFSSRCGKPPPGCGSPTNRNGSINGWLWSPSLAISASRRPTASRATHLRATTDYGRPKLVCITKDGCRE